MFKKFVFEFCLTSYHIVILVKLVYFWVVSNVEIEGPHKLPELVYAFEIFLGLECSIIVTAWLVQLDTYPETLIEAWDLAHELDFASVASNFQLAA